MDFKTYFFGLSVPERAAFAERAGTSRGYLNQVAYGNKLIELGFADVLCALSNHAVDLDAMPLTENAQRQRVIRAQGDFRDTPAEPAPAPAKAA